MGRHFNLRDTPLLARKFLYAIATIIMLILVAAIGWNLFQDRILRFTFVPRVAFTMPAGEVDYTKPASWAARPSLPDDPSRWLPPGVARTKPGPVAIFFVPPTTYLGRDRWNAPIDDPSAEARHSSRKKREKFLIL